MSKRKPKPDPVLLDLEAKLLLAQGEQDRYWSKLTRAMNGLMKRRKRVLDLTGRIRRHKSAISGVNPPCAGYGQAVPDVGQPGSVVVSRPSAGFTGDQLAHHTVNPNPTPNPKG